MKYMTPKWYKMMQSIHLSKLDARKLERAVNDAMESYDREYRKNFGNHEPAFGRAHLHDSVVIACHQIGPDLIIDLKPDMTRVNQLVFKTV